MNKRERLVPTQKKEKLKPPTRGTLPPMADSFEVYVQARWNEILSDWRRGWAADQKLIDLEQAIEFRRIKIFDRREVAEEYDWESDWHRARIVHATNIEFVTNRRKYIDDLRIMWTEWESRAHTHISGVSLEALRSMVLVNGAAIIAALAVLTGQVSAPPPIVITVAKVTVFSSVVSILMLATGHALLVDRIGNTSTRIRAIMVGNVRHSRLYAISRYLRRYLNPRIDLANALIYGSIAVFALSAFICALMLLAV